MFICTFIFLLHLRKTGANDGAFFRNKTSECHFLEMFLCLLIIFDHLDYELNGAVSKWSVDM